MSCFSAIFPLFPLLLALAAMQMCVRAADKQAPIQGQKARGRRERKRESARERRERRRDSARERERAREQEQQPDELEEVEQNKEHFVRFNTFINKGCHLAT